MRVDLYGELLSVPEAMVISPSAGSFRPEEGASPGALVTVGQLIGTVHGPRTETPICSPFAGELVRMLVWPSERLRPGQGVAWLRFR